MVIKHITNVATPKCKHAIIYSTAVMTPFSILLQFCLDCFQLGLERLVANRLDHALDLAGFIREKVNHFPKCPSPPAK